MPRWLLSRLETEAQKFLSDGKAPQFDFREPAGEPALTDPNSVSWQVFKNPVALFIGGITAVILELAEARVRTGVWEHTGFRTDPVRRLKRTGMAAMMTIYGPRSAAEAMIAGVGRMHDRVKGTTPCGQNYSANDPELLEWVNATASFGFLTAYRSYVHPLSAAEVSRFYAEAVPVAHLYGVPAPPGSEEELIALFERIRPKLQPSPVIFEFLEIMCAAPVFPTGPRWFQRLLVRGGVEILPGWVRDRLKLGPEWRVRPWEKALIKTTARIADRIALNGTPPVEACLRLGLPADFLFGNRNEKAH